MSTMGLKDYFRKRNFGTTPEPKDAGKALANHSRRAVTPAQSQPSKNRPGAPPHPAPSKLAFVVQEHHASSLHYDFRLEIDGVLKSWAVPKGPSLDPHQHHLAIQTEDHPYAYRKFEGIIPEGNYGAGNVIIWDEGWYEARKGDPKDSEKTLRAELKKGHLTFILHGKKLRGEFALIKMHGTGSGDKNAWLLVKKGDAYATTRDVTKQDESVKSHRRVDDLGGKAPDIGGLPKKAAPWHVRPMLATLVDEPFSREGWLFEIKWDGYRAIGSAHNGDATLYSRNHIDFAAKYPAVAEALHAFRHDVVVDGEIVVMDAAGVPHFEWLQQAGQHHTARGSDHASPPPESPGTLRYCLFDILWCDGRDVRGLPLADRKRLLQHVMPRHDRLTYSDHVEANGNNLFREMQRRGLEGMIAKRADSPYREGERTMEWLKVKTHQRQEVVIGGYTEPRGSRQYLGSLVVGVYERGELVYVGHSGGGIPDDLRRTLRDRLAKLERRTSPFKTEPKPNAPVHWVQPRLVCDMSFAEWTSEGFMRHPQFEGLRPDKKAVAVRREKPRHVTSNTPAQAAQPKRQSAAGPAAGAGQSASNLPFEFTHPDKVFFPKTGYTKHDLLRYYEAVASYILPYLKDRPHSLNRMPHGITGESFYQKNNEHLPDWVPHADIFSASNNENLHWMVGGGLHTLLYMVQLGCVEINPWNSRVGHLDKPDWIVIDLDPEGVGFSGVIQVARTVKEVCDEWGIPSHPKTSGKTGIHIYLPMQARYTYEQAKNVAHLIALEVNKRQPQLTSVERLPEKRRHKIYVDFLQNREGQTLAAPYSVRPTPQATVSMPLHWDEVKPGLAPADFTIRNALQRLKRTGDLWQPVLGKGISLPALLKRIPADTSG